MGRLIVGIGELLWDILPGGRQLGGAPGNFAWHAQSLGHEGCVFSSVGDDPEGREAIERIAALGLATDGISIDPIHSTGRSTVTVDDEGVPSFRVHEDAAWDYIPMGPALEKAAPRVDAVFFGTLGQRAAKARQTTQAFLERLRPDSVRLFDLNLRPPWYGSVIIESGLAAATVVKLNTDELAVVSRLAGLQGSEPGRMAQLAEQFDLRAVALTRGPLGSMLYMDGGLSVEPAVPVKVVDTVGAGDAFAAALVAGILEGRDLDVINRRANRVASFVCSRPGATPILPSDLVDNPD